MCFDQLLFFLQIQKMNLGCEETFQIPGVMAADVNDEDQILVRTAVDGKSYIIVTNRFDKEASSKIPSLCNHTAVCLVAHPTDAGFVLESCGICEVIRNYNIHTGQCSIAYKGCSLYRISHGPTSSILAFWHGLRHFELPHPRLSMIKWDTERHELHIDRSVYLRGGLVQMCYSELFNMLVAILPMGEIEALRLESQAAIWKLSDPIWKLSGDVDGLTMKPDVITSDHDGNIYVGDGPNNRILKISSMTGDVRTIIPLKEENNQEMDGLFWTHNGPCLIVIRGDTISNYYIPKLE